MKNKKIKLTPQQQAALDIIKTVDYDLYKSADPNYNLDEEDVDDLLRELDEYFDQFYEIMQKVV